jgi:hypothetical protein
MKDPTATLSGHAQKGPFILGSTLLLTAISGNGVATGKVFTTSTTDSLGTYSTSLAYTGGLDVQAQGYYWDEVTNALSSGTITLQALVEIPAAGGAKSANVNVVTHLARPRALALMAGGTGLAAAEAQAESELVSALGLGGTGLTPGAAGIAMNELGADDDANGYLIALSAALVEVVIQEDGTTSFDANLQSLLDTIASDLAPSGALPSTVTSEIVTAEEALDLDFVRYSLTARAASLGSAATAADPDRAVDSDGDGYVNAADTCPLVANPTQSTIPAYALCNATRHITPLPTVVTAPLTPLVADFEGTGHPGVLYGDGTSWFLLLGDGTGGFAAPVTATLPSSFTPLVAADLNGDGHIDLVGGSAWSAGTGTGSFGAATSFPGSVTGPIAVVDFNRDGVLDVAAWGGTGVALLLATSPGVFAAPVITAVTDVTGPVALQSADLNADGAADLAVAGSTGAASLLGNGKGALSLSWSSKEYSASRLAIGDFNGNEFLDFGFFDGASLTVAFGNGLGGFGAPVTTALASPCAAAADFNADGKVDVWEPGAFLASDGKAFVAAQPIQMSSGSTCSLVLTPDLNADGVPDAIVLSQSSALDPPSGFIFESYVSGEGSPAYKCPFKTCDAACEDTSDDVFNCGKCGFTCALGAPCSSGKCACATADSVCDGQCVNLETNIDHCGGCHHPCRASGESCTAGKCACPAGEGPIDGVCCPTGDSVCSGECVDEQTDTRNCGMCGNGCASGTCVGGACTCPTGESVCGGACCDIGQACDRATHTCTFSCSSERPCNGGCCSAAADGTCQPGDTVTACGAKGVCADCATDCSTPGACLCSASGKCGKHGRVFGDTGTTQHFHVPKAVTEVTIVAWGASAGAAGGSTTATIPVTPGEDLVVMVNVGGGGGGAGGEANGAPGGGASDVRQGGSGIADRVVVAGGAGGNAGKGGFYVGAGGSPALSGETLAIGGTGGSDLSSNGVGGGGGGGGYYGGFGGSGGWTIFYGGDGGSSYAEPAATGVMMVAGGAAGPPQVTISW